MRLAAVAGAEPDRGGAGRRERVLFAAAVERDEPGGGEGADHGAPAEGGVRRSSDGRSGGAGQQGGEEEDGAWASWAPSEEWWSKDSEIAICHEVIDELMSSR